MSDETQLFGALVAAVVAVFVVAPLIVAAVVRAFKLEI